MLGSLAGNLTNPLNPVNRCCCANDSGQMPCSLGGANMTEILDETPSIPGTVEVLVDNKVLKGALPRGPRDRVVPTYMTSEHVELRGQPVHTGTILQLKLGESIHEMTLALHVNGFRLSPSNADEKGAPMALARVWSPFSLVEKCQVKTMQHSAFWAVFKLTVFSTEGSDQMFYFATSGGDAYKERDRWVDEISNAISEVTLSLFPPHAITVRPVPGVQATSTRIMAGYLLQSGQKDNVSLFYCELHAYSGGEARLAIYKDEWCEHEVTSMYLADTSVVSTRKGSYCTVFGVDEHRFCARTREEKDLWLRAVSNIKVKLMFDAPEPTHEELAIFREAVYERIQAISYAEEGKNPLLTPVVRKPFPMSPRGDLLHPDPIDEMSECVVTHASPAHIAHGEDPHRVQRVIRTVWTDDESVESVEMDANGDGTIDPSPSDARRLLGPPRQPANSERIASNGADADGEPSPPREGTSVGSGPGIAKAQATDRSAAEACVAVAVPPQPGLQAPGGQQPRRQLQQRAI